MVPILFFHFEVFGTLYSRSLYLAIGVAQGRGFITLLAQFCQLQVPGKLPLLEVTGRSK